MRLARQAGRRWPSSGGFGSESNGYAGEPLLYSSPLGWSSLVGGSDGSEGTARWQP
jgi:hypothetical protein